MKWTVISAVNDESVLQSCLLKSPGIRSATEVILQRGFRSAAAAYNEGIDKAKSDILVFVHQDVYFPDGWIESVENALNRLAKQDPNWGVLGVWGVTASGGRAGCLYWTGLSPQWGVAVDGRVEVDASRLLEKSPHEALTTRFDGVVEVNSLDEVVLIIRKSSELRFDEKLVGYHLYGTDICLEAKRRAMKCYAIYAFCLHNTDIGGMLPRQFWAGCWFMRRKWSDELPITTPCAEITRWGWPIIRWNIVRLINLASGRHKHSQRVADPAKIHEELIQRGVIRPWMSPSPGEIEANKSSC